MKSPIIVLIPARFSSTRFPGKALALINGKAMVLHVLDKARAVMKNVYVATDDQRIAELVKKEGGQAIMTGKHHRSGTERCAEAIEKTSFNMDQEAIVINLQGDEPFIPSDLISKLAEVFKDPDIEIATLVHQISNQEDLLNANRVKVVKDLNDKALYFSRSLIPYHHEENNVPDVSWFQHIGVYAFRLRILKEIVQLPPGKLEIQESLEQLRWMENGYKIHCLETNYDGFGIDTPEDLEKVNSNFGVVGL